MVHPVSINPVLSTIKLLKWFIVCQEAAVMPDISISIPIALASEKASELIKSTYWRLLRLYNIYLHQDDPCEKMVMRLTVILHSFYFFMEIMIQR